MSIEQYWMGSHLDLDNLWQDYDNGAGYAQKLADGPVYLLRLTFGEHPLHLPLFDAEVLFKTVKGTFHDVKDECMTRGAYERSAPIFLHRVDRGSGVFEFLAQFDPLMTWIVALGAAAAWYQNSRNAGLQFDEKRLNFIRSSFPAAGPSEVQAYMKAWTAFGRRRVLHRLIGQHLEKVEVSRAPHEAAKTPSMVNMESVVDLHNDEIRA